jgi:hypothetical protein
MDMNIKEIEDWKEKELAKATTEKERQIIEAKYKMSIIQIKGNKEE